MKRLIKNSSNDLDTIVQALYSHIYEPNPGKLISIIDDIISNNADCIYNGVMYRGMIINVDYGNDSIYKEDLIDIINTKIKQTDEYASFSQYDSSAQEFLDNHMDNFNITNNSISVIIKQNGNGIDINKLLIKYINICADNNRDDLTTTLQNLYDSYSDENEIFAKLNNYELVEINEELIEDLENNIMFEDIYL